MHDIVEQADKFQIIRGIGGGREKWLQETFGVYTFGALASLTVDNVESELVNARPAISRGVERGDVAAWLKEARKFAARKIDQKRGAKADKKDRPEWKKDVRFFVEFQTREGQSGGLEKQIKVHEMETGKGDEWSGYDLDGPAKWMLGWLEQARADRSRTQEVVPAAEPRQAAKKESPAQPTITFEMEQLLVFQPPAAMREAGVGLPDEVFNGTLLADLPFTMECHFVVGQEGSESGFDPPVPYRLELLATNRVTGQDVTLGRKDDVAEEAGLQKVAITEVCLAGGVYRVEAIVRSTDFVCQPGFMEIPLLRSV